MSLPMADMDLALQAAGIPFVAVGYQPADPTGAADWRTRGRPASTGPFHPEGVLCHHTASPEGCSDHTDISCILAGNGSAPGPISQIYIGRTGVVYLIAAGRANHGGQGIRPGIDDGCEDMNAALVGIEAGNNGVGEYWADNMTTVYGRVVAALCDYYGWPIDAVYLHATTGPPYGGCNSKIDPAGPWQREPHLGGQTWDLNEWRHFVLDAGGLPGPIPPEEEDIVTEQDIQAIAERVWQVALHNYQGNSEQAAMFLLGFAHSEAYDGSLKREVDNMMDGTRRMVQDMIRFAHYEAATANEKCDRIIELLESNR